MKKTIKKIITRRVRDAWTKYASWRLVNLVDFEGDPYKECHDDLVVWNTLNELCKDLHIDWRV